MTREEFDTLCRDDVRRAVEENLGRDPLAVALDRRTPHAALVATQVKYLERARTKLLLLRRTLHPAAARLRTGVERGVRRTQRSRRATRRSI